MLIRSTAPGLGANSNPYQQPGEWEFNVSVRKLTSDDHYRGTEEQVQRHTLGTYVINHQNMVDLGATYAFSQRFTLSVGIPFVAASWSIPSPTSPAPGPRAQQDARGIGDISTTGRYWLLDPNAHATSNVAIGVGVKAPSGEYAAQDLLPDRNGQNVEMRYVDQSIQPGDGGWGLLFEAQGFRQVKRAFLFGSVTYLANPRNTNGTPSLTVSRGGTPASSQWDRLVNSVPDQYIVRAGAAVPVGKGLAISAAMRFEGLPRYDLIGHSNGFRRPGRAGFIEPGLSFSKGRSTLSVQVPIAFYYNRMPDPNTGLEGDATFPRYIALGAYSVRFGGN